MDDSQCPSAYLCIEEICQIPPPLMECANDADCETEGQVCISGICGVLEEGMCRNDLDCELNEMCVNRRCMRGSPLDDCQVDTQCPGEQICLEGRCSPPPDECAVDNDCSESETCMQGICTYDGMALCTRTCAYDDDGSCDDGGADSNFSLCEFGTDCRDCGPRCRNSEECEPGEDCQMGSCVGGAEIECTRDRDCPEDQRCVNRNCRPRPPRNCDLDDDCPQGNYCNRGQCEEGQRPCEVEDDCGANQQCQNGFCVPSGEDGCLQPTPYEIGDLITSDSSGLSQNHSAACGNGSLGPEAVYRFEAQAAGAVCLTTRDSSFDTVLHVREAECGNPDAQIQCNDDDQAFNLASGLNSTVEIQTQAATEYFIFVDGYGENNAGLFRLSSSEGPCLENPPPACTQAVSCPNNQVCSNAQCVECLGNADCVSPDVCRGGICTLPTSQIARVGDCVDPSPINGFGLFEGTTRMVQDSYQGSCGGRGGENILVYEAPQGGLICADTENSAYDTVLYVRSDSCGGREVVCNDDAIGIQSQVEFMGVEGAPYFIFVDGYSGTGDFTLRIRPGACP